MDGLRAEIEARKKRTEELKAKSGASGGKFVRRGDIAAAEQRELQTRVEVGCSRFMIPSLNI